MILSFGNKYSYKYCVCQVIYLLYFTRLKRCYIIIYAKKVFGLRLCKEILYCICAIGRNRTYINRFSVCHLDHVGNYRICTPDRNCARIWKVETSYSICWTTEAFIASLSTLDKNWTRIWEVVTPYSIRWTTKAVYI